MNSKSSNSDVEKFPTLSRNNYRRILAAGQGSCYFCLRHFAATDIDETAFCDDNTVLCPHCGIDAVVPGTIDSATLVAACTRWFAAKNRQGKTHHAHAK